MEFEQEENPVSRNQVDLKIAIDPRINATDRKTYVINKGARNVSQTVYVSNNVSQSSISFTCPPPSPLVFVDREVLLSMTIPFTFTRTGGTTPIFGGSGVTDQISVGRFISSQSFPLHNLIQTLSVKINNASISQQVSDFIDPLLRYNSDTRELLYSNSSTPTLQDQAQTYSELANSSRNPLTSYDDSTPNANDKRGSFLRVIQNDNNIGVFILEVTEPLIISPLLWNRKKEFSEGLFGVQNFDVTLSLNDAVQRCLSIDTTNFNMTGITPSYNLSAGSQNLAFTYLTPPENLKVPSTNVYQYAEINRYTSNISGVLTAGQSLQYTAQAVTLNYIPRRIYMYARQTPSYDKPLTYLNISGLSINFNNVTGILSSCNSQMLHRISLANGCNLSALQWDKYVGSVMCVQFDRDISLQMNDFIGKNGQYNFQPTLQLKNISSQTVSNLQFFIVVVGDGLATISGQSMSLRSGVLDDTSIFGKRLEELPLINYEQSLINRDFTGGSFISKTKDMLKKGAQAVEKYMPKAVDAVKKYGPSVVSGISKALPLLLALGYDEETCKQMIRDGSANYVLEANGLTGGGLTGGKMANKLLMNNKRINKRLY